MSIYNKAIPRADIDIMIDQAETIRDRAIFIFFRDTACRGSEAAAMRWENVDLDEGKAYVAVRAASFGPSVLSRPPPKF